MENDGLAVAVIGLGGIARNAYLPVLGTRADLRLRLMTRDRTSLDALGAAYRVPGQCRFTELEALLDAGPPRAAFVHVATVAHVEIVTRLLDAGIPTYVDKPLSDTLAESRALVEHAERTGTP